MDTIVVSDNTDKTVMLGTIASGGTESETFDVGNLVACAVWMPGTITGTAVSFKKSYDGTNFVALLDPDTGANYSVPVAASKSTPLNPLYFYGARYLKVVSNAAEGAARVVGLEARY